MLNLFQPPLGPIYNFTSILNPIRLQTLNLLENIGLMYTTNLTLSVVTLSCLIA